jgi:hypothetical protein
MACVEAVVSRRIGGLGSVQLDKGIGGMRCYFHTDVFIGTCSDLGRALQDDRIDGLI